MNFDPEPYAAGIRAANELERRRIADRLERARNEAKRLADEIRAADATVRNVILFGSTARGNPSREDFDLDLALDGGDAYKAMDIAAGSPFKVDLVSLDLLPAGMRDAVLATGVRL